MGAPSISRSLRNGWETTEVHFNGKQLDRKRSKQFAEKLIILKGHGFSRAEKATKQWRALLSTA
jgi:hypothetical protein